MVDYDEENQFAMAHEKKHRDGKHSEEVLKRERRSVGSILAKIKAGMGQDRIHEWGADIGATDELSNLGINPIWGKLLNERFRALALPTDTAHGQFTDRVLNQVLMTNVKNMPALNLPLHEVPSEIKAAVEEVRQKDLFPSLYHQFFIKVETGWELKAQDIISKMSLDTLLVTIPDLIGRRGSLSQASQWG